MSRCRALLAVLWGIGAVAVSSGCASSPPPHTNARFAWIQRHESDLERAIADGDRWHEALALGETTACETLEDTASRVRDAAHDVCDASGRDSDAAVRCERARRRAADAVARWGTCPR